MAKYYWIDFNMTEPPVKAPDKKGDDYLLRERNIHVEVYRDPDNNKLYGFVIDAA